MGRNDPSALLLRDVSLVREGRAILDRVTWSVSADDRWVVLGRNGSGKSSLMKIASLYLHPSSGLVEVLGERLGRTDVRSLRARIGVASGGMADQLRADLCAADVVMTAKNAALEPWWHSYDEADRQRRSTASNGWRSVISPIAHSPRSPRASVNESCSPAP